MSIFFQYCQYATELLERDYQHLVTDLVSKDFHFEYMSDRRLLADALVEHETEYPTEKYEID